jgi:P-type Cu2+ transporter
MDATDHSTHDSARNGHDRHHGHHAGHAAGPRMPPGTSDRSGHDAHAGHSVETFRDKFWISLLLTLPTLVWGHMLQGAFGYTAPHFPGSHWIAPAFGTAVFAYGGRVFIQGAVDELKARLPGMMTLIGLAISVAFILHGESLRLILFSVVVVLGARVARVLGLLEPVLAEQRVRR